MQRRVKPSVGVLVLAALATCLSPFPPLGRADGGRIVLGITPERNLFEQHARFTRLADYLGRRAGLAVEISVLSRYGNVIENFVAHHLEGAFLGSFAGALAHERLGAEALVRPVTPDGEATYHGYIIVRRDSRIKTVKDMQGRVMAFVDRDTSCGYLFPLAYLRRHGVENAQTYFSETYFAGSHDAVIEALLGGLADVGVAKNTVFDELRARNPDVNRTLRVLARSPAFPSHGLFVRMDLSPTLKERLRSSLLNMSGNPEGRKVLATMGLARFEPAESHDDYQAVFDLARQAGIDLKTYRFVNR